HLADDGHELADRLDVLRPGGIRRRSCKGKQEAQKTGDRRPSVHPSPPIRLRGMAKPRAVEQTARRDSVLVTAAVLPDGSPSIKCRISGCEILSILRELNLPGDGPGASPRT